MQQRCAEIAGSGSTPGGGRGLQNRRAVREP